MRVAVIGSGIAGLGCAWLLQREHEVTLFEANDYFGGHTHTHDITLGEQRYAVDTGFIVHNPRHYPLLTQHFTELKIDSQPTTMSFAVRSDRTGLEYNTASLKSLFCQRRNLASPRFYRMLGDLVRFYRAAPALLTPTAPEVGLGGYLTAGGYGSTFIEEHLVPMASALWSAPAQAVLALPAKFLVRFMANHNMLQLSGRPPWYVVQGGSASYVRALRARWQVAERRACPVRGVRRDERGVTVESAAGAERFDQAVLACHSDQALAVLEDPSPDEREILSAIRYQRNDVILHTDPALLPRNRGAWAAWNALVPKHSAERCTVSYCMNLLQGLASPEPLIVSLNPHTRIDPARVLRRLTYSHPLFTPQALAAQARRAAIQGVRRTYFAGAYWGFGFHEDGLLSAVEVCRAFGVRSGVARDAPGRTAGAPSPVTRVAA
jgi:predicted NAD/FAD-binding protein